MTDEGVPHRVVARLDAEAGVQLLLCLTDADGAFADDLDQEARDGRLAVVAARDAAARTVADAAATVEAVEVSVVVPAHVMISFVPLWR